MTIWGTTVTVTVLVATEFCAFLYMHYDVTPPNSQNIYSWSSSFSVGHRLSCSKGGLLIAHHNEVCDKLLNISWQASTFNWVRGKPLYLIGPQKIRRGCTSREGILDTRGGVSSKAHDKYRLTPSLISDLEMLMRTPTSMTQWINHGMLGEVKEG